MTWKRQTFEQKLLFAIPSNMGFAEGSLSPAVQPLQPPCLRVGNYVALAFAQNLRLWSFRADATLPARQEAYGTLQSTLTHSGCCCLERTVYPPPTTSIDTSGVCAKPENPPISWLPALSLLIKSNSRPLIKSAASTASPMPRSAYHIQSRTTP